MTRRKARFTMKEVTTLIKAAQKENVRLVIELDEVGKFRVIVDGTSNPAKSHHDIDFGPWPKQTALGARDTTDTMRESEDEIPRLMKLAHDKWKVSIPGTALSNRERKALEQLAGYGVEIPVHHLKVKGCGPDTVERLEARGYLTIRNHTEYPDRVDSYILTQAGMGAWEELRLKALQVSAS